MVHSTVLMEVENSFICIFGACSLFSVVAAWRVSLARCAVSSGEATVGPRCGLWDVAAALSRYSKVIPSAGPLARKLEKWIYKASFAQRFWSSKGLYVCE